MIVDFTVSNYRSIKEPVTLSFVAQKGRTTKGTKNSIAPSDDNICAGYEVKGRDFKLLPVAAIFGANASGKSNVIRALDTLLLCMTFKAKGRNPFSSDTLPFRLDKTIEEPSCFELRYADDGVIFTFSLELKEGTVMKERLDYSPAPNQRQSTRLLYDRTFKPETNEYEVTSGETFTGPHVQLLPTIQSDELYFPIISRLQVPIIGNFIKWLRLMAGGGIFGEGDEPEFQRSASWFLRYPEDKRLAIQILKEFDTGLEDLVITHEDGSKDEYHVQAVHRTKEGMVHWDFQEESLGTQRLFILLYDIVTALEMKNAVIVDEFGANFHPKMTREIIKLFHSPATNPRGAQLIFTSHDNTLWRNVLRRDEIWLTEKQEDQSTKLTPLSVYKPRNDLALDKAYLDGRFGAVPLIGDVEGVLEKAVEDRELADAA